MTALSTSAPSLVDATTSSVSVVERLTLAVVALIPLAVGWVLWAAPGGDADFNRRVTLAPFDLALAALVTWWTWTRFTGRRRRSASTVTSAAVSVASATPSHGLLAQGPWGFLGAATIVVYAIAFAAHPSPRGLEYAIRLAAAAVLVDVVRSLDRSGLRRLGIVMAIAAVIQSALAIAQSLNGTAFEFYPFDHAGPLFAFGDTHAGRGGLTHPYHLAVFLLVAIFAALVASRADRSDGRSGSWETRLWLLAAFIMGAGLAVTFSRTMVLSLVPASICWWIARRRNRPFIGAVFVGLAVTAVVFSSGWVTRAEQSTGSGVDRGRSQLASDAFDMAADHPLVGVGPSRYVIATAERDIPEARWLPAHNVVAHSAAEFGYLGGALVALIGMFAALRYLRRGLPILGGALVIAPFFLLDAYPYVFPTGIAISAVWIGLLENRSLTVDS